MASSHNQIKRRLQWRSWVLCFFVKHTYFWHQTLAFVVFCHFAPFCTWVPHLGPKFHETTTLLPCVDPPWLNVPPSNGPLVGPTQGGMLVMFCYQFITGHNNMKFAHVTSPHAWRVNIGWGSFDHVIEMCHCWGL
jgi:hypothetical protein